MKTRKILFCFIFCVLCLGCRSNGFVGVTVFVTTEPVSQVTITQPPPSPSIPTQIISRTPTATRTQEVEKTATLTPSVTSTVTSEIGLQNRCLSVEAMAPSEISARGNVVFSSIDGSYIFIVDMATGTTSTMINGNDIIISLDGKFIAFYRFTTDQNNNFFPKELIIADASGQELQALPWEDDWQDLLGWATNDRVIISIPHSDEEGIRIPFSVLALNPFNGERQIITPNFPEFLYTTTTILPYWDGWSGVIYDPTFTRGIYPRFIGENKETFTYGIWDLLEKHLVASLDNLFSSYSAFNDIFPRAWWSQDGSQFVFRNRYISADRTDLELYKVSRDGQVEQLTKLAPSVVFFDSFSWSPDGRYIATFVYTSNLENNHASVAVFDNMTLNVINYCLPIAYKGDGYGIGLNAPKVPIWSPNGTQFLVVDWYEKDHKRVILVDTNQGFTVQIAEDMEPVGWMLAP